MRDLLQVEGAIEKNGQVQSLPRVEGKWDESLTAFLPDGSKDVIWKVNPPAADPTRYLHPADNSLDMKPMSTRCK